MFYWWYFGQHETAVEIRSFKLEFFGKPLKRNKSIITSSSSRSNDELPSFLTNSTIPENTIKFITFRILYHKKIHRYSCKSNLKGSSRSVHCTPNASVFEQDLLSQNGNVSNTSFQNLQHKKTK